MSLISDTDFLIHSLRLSYLRDVEDPYGPRTITLDPEAYNSNPYTLTASLADVERWPELAMPESPHLSEEDEDRPSGFPGANLRHTRTIMGGRTGGLGMRVHGKRASTSKRLSITPKQADAPVRNFVDKAPLGNSGPATGSLAKPKEHTLAQVMDVESSPPHTVQIQEPSAVPEAPVQKVVQFIPKFKGAQEMEARRRIRMAARRGAGEPAPPPIAIDSSSSEDEPPPNPELSSDSDFGDGVDSDSGDEFDPDFAHARTPGGMSDDDLSMAGGSASNSSAPMSVHRPALSPVSAAAKAARRSPPQTRSGRPPRKLSNTAAKPGSSGSSSIPLASPNAAEMTFTRKRVPPVKPQKSLLTAMLASSGSSINPFSEVYASVSGRGESQCKDVLVFFPHATQPAGKGMRLNVRKDAVVEEVVGFALWTYWEEGWMPKLDDGLSGESDPKWEQTMSAVGWVLMIAEDDGEVDDDFPAPDRLAKVSEFNFDYAVLPATAAQIARNEERKPARAVTSKRPTDKLAPTLSNLALPNIGQPLAMLGSTPISLPLSTSLGPSFSHGPQIFLRITVADANPDAAHFSSTIEVSAGMYMQEALEQICRKKRIANPKDYCLLLDDQSMIIPLDRTVASLQGKRELILCERSMVSKMGGPVLKVVGKTTDPNASIFKRMSEPPEAKISSALDYTAAYKKYTIYRKMAMLVARQERTLAIDGKYIHIMPPSNRNKAAVFDSGKTMSFHIKSVVECIQSQKTSASFKLVLNRASGNKRYELEAESPKLAGEIVQTVRSAMLERSGTVNKARRSRHV